MAPALLFAQLNSAWFNEGIVALEHHLIAAGWRALPWISNEDWYHDAGWIDNVHPTRTLAGVVLQRLYLHLPVDSRVLIIGDSTLTFHFDEYNESGFHYDWCDREAFLHENGIHDCALWAVPGARLGDICKQLEKALSYDPMPIRRDPCRWRVEQMWR
jgi:hypothetical protein